MIGQICQRRVDFAERDESIQAAAQRMDARKVGSLVIRDAAEHPVGILTDRDVAVRVVGAKKDPVATRVADVMTTNPKSLSTEDSLDWALEVMKVEGIRRVLVNEPDGSFAGILTLDDVMSYLANTLRSVRDLLEESSPQGLVHS